MDGRWKLAFAGGVLWTGLTGCTTTKVSPSLPTVEPVSSSKNSVVIAEPPDEGEEKQGPLAPSTLVLFAGMWVEDVAKNPNKPAADREKSLSNARKVYQDVLHREPQNVDALFGLGQLYQVTGETDKQREIETRALNLHPNNPKVLAWVAVRQAQAKQWDAAIEIYQKAVKLDPENRTYRIQLGFTLARAGRYAEAYEWMSRCMREAEARFNLAQMMVHNGEVEKARIELQLALHADPNFRPAAEHLAMLPNSTLPNITLPNKPVEEPTTQAAPRSNPPVAPAATPQVETIPPIRVGGQ